MHPSGSERHAWHTCERSSRSSVRRLSRAVSFGVALTLFGVTLHDAHTGEAAPGVSLVLLRDLAAICGESDYRAVEPDDAVVLHHAGIVAGFATRGPVLPAPVGVVFRSTESVQRWLELHYGALTEALSYVDNRVAARVHVRAIDHVTDEVTSELVSVASDGLRALRRAAVASLPLRANAASGVLSSAAFLVEELNWKNFASEVDAQAKMTPNVTFELTGPWAPYDFVKMQLGT